MTEIKLHLQIRDESHAAGIVQRLKEIWEDAASEGYFHVFPPKPCPYDTDGDGNCGRRPCPHCRPLY